MPSESVEEIASEMRAAVSGGPQAVGKVLSTHYAETMHIGHEPALPADGLHQRDAFIAHMESENAAFAASLPDMGYESLIETSGDEITATTTISGTMADGTKVRATIPVTYTIGSGEIVRLVTVVDAATVATMLEVLSAGGFRRSEPPA